MQKKSIKIIVVAIFLIVLVALSVVIFNNYKGSAPSKNSSQKTEEVKSTDDNHSKSSLEVSLQGDEESKDYSGEKILKVTKEDLTIGDKNAPVKLVEYASLSCPHCASFYRESFEKIKEKYIDSGKVLFVFRDFPLNEPALIGATYAKCVAQEQGSEKYFSTIKSLFKVQDSWAFDGNFIGRLEAIANLEGIGSEKFSECVNNKSIQDSILEHRMIVAKQLQIKSVPSFFINGELSSGYVDYVTLERLIDKKLAEVK